MSGNRDQPTLTSSPSTSSGRTPGVFLCRTLFLCWTLWSAAALHARDDEWTIERLETTREAGTARTVAVRNVHGDVRCRVGEDDELYVLANVQRHAEDPRKADVLVDQEGGRITVEVVYPEVTGGRITAEMERRRVDVTLLLPASASLQVTTADGLIEARGLSRPFAATSESGRVVFRTSGVAQVRNGRGTIDATFRATDWAEESTLVTSTGDVTVYLPPDAAARVTAETAGELSTDYSIEIEPHEHSSMKTAVARIGEGGGRLTVRSEKGRVRLLRSRW